jgi:branched-chain amino acid aminotransferase
MKVYINGRYYQRKDAHVSVFDHGLLYGDGVFEGLRIYQGRIFKLEEHISRLYKSARAILLTIPMPEAAMQKAVVKTVAVNKKVNGYVRLLVTRGEGALGIDPRSCKKPAIIIIADDIQLYPREYYENGIAIVTSSSRRMPSDCLDPRIKSLNYLNNIMAKLEAHQAGCLEAVMLNQEGFIAECTADNIFIVRGQTLCTPAPYYGALDGITRNTIIEIAGSLGIPTEETALTRFDLYNADECFMTGTGAEIMPVIKIDGRVIGKGRPGPIARILKTGFDEYVNAIAGNKEEVYQI